MQKRYITLAGFAALTLLSQTAFAFTTQAMPTDSHGVAMADPDDQFDTQTTTTPGQAQGYSFNTGSGSVWVGAQGASNNGDDGVRTGSQMFDPAQNGAYPANR